MLILNTLLGITFHTQWGGTKEIETLVIMFLVMLFLVILSDYHNAYFRKNDNVKGYIWLFLISGVFNFFVSFEIGGFEVSHISTDGKVSSENVQAIGNLIWLSIPITYVIRNAIDKRKEDKNEN